MIAAAIETNGLPRLPALKTCSPPPSAHSRNSSAGCWPKNGGRRAALKHSAPGSRITKRSLARRDPRGQDAGAAECPSDRDLGVPGTGKSCFARALGNEMGRPTLLLDVGALYGSLVGATEQNVRQALRLIDAMAPCVAFLDEIEKALAGAGGTGDSGVATRLFGTLLTYLSDHESDVFVIASSNDISKLPPEFARAERWDAVYFLDLPTTTEKDAIWTQYRRVNSLFSNIGDPLRID